VRIVLLNDRKTEREAIMRALPPATYRAEAVSDEPSALAAITRDAPQIVVFSVPSKGGQDLARRLKAVDASGQAYLLALFESAPSCGEVASIIDAGVHDFLRRPVVEAELLARLQAPRRLMRWAQSVARPAVFDLSAQVDVGGMKAWKDLGALVAEDLSQVAGQPFQMTPGWPQHFTHELESATIRMSLAGDQLEVRVSIVVDSTTSKWLKEALLGDPNASTEATADVLREFANTAGGALKRAALSENVTLTTGIPSTDKSPGIPNKHPCWTLTLEGGAGCVAVVGEIRTRENQRVPASQLSEGMVLAHDVRNEGGILLVPAGSRLTGTSAAKLAQMLGPRFFLEVAPAA
jgi:DNA-binding response OmpR family regulator